MKRLAALHLAICLILAVPAVLPASEHSGVTFGPPSQEGGIPVESVRKSSPAAVSGLQPGDLVLEVDGINVKGKKPAEVQERIEDKVASGRSSVVVYLRNNWKTVAWICPLRLSAAQEGILRFADSFRSLHDDTETVWNDICRSFNRSMKSPAEKTAFLDGAGSWREDLRRRGREGAHMEIPSSVSGDARKDLDGMTRGFSKQQALRREALSYMEDYLENQDISRQPAVFTELDSPYEHLGERQTLGERRWNKVAETAKKAHRSDLRLQVLFRDALEKSGLTDSDLINPVL